MTEAGEKWVEKCSAERADQSEPMWAIVHALGTSSAEFWLRAFCDAIQNKGENGRPHVLSFKETGIALIEVKRELLGD